VRVTIRRHREGFILAARAFAGTPYDGHTLQDTLIRWSGRAPSRLRGSTSIAATGGHDYTGAGEVLIAGRRRGLTPTMRRELRRRSALEATIGHAKDDHRMGRNFLLGSFGDAINALAARPRPFDQKVKRSPACSP